jgi:hypothetical protein
MDEKTRQLLSDAEILAESIHGPFTRDSIGDLDVEFLQNAPRVIVELCAAVLAQSERADRTEKDGDAWRKEANGIDRVLGVRADQIDCAMKLSGEQTVKYMRTQSALDSEKESHRRTMSELGVETDRVAKLKREVDGLNRETETKANQIAIWLARSKGSKEKP